MTPLESALSDKEGFDWLASADVLAASVLEAVVVGLFVNISRICWNADLTSIK
jgi:hypothetical protein